MIWMYVYMCRCIHSYRAREQVVGSVWVSQSTSPISHFTSQLLRPGARRLGSGRQLLLFGRWKLMGPRRFDMLCSILKCFFQSSMYWDYWGFVLYFILFLSDTKYMALNATYLRTHSPQPLCSAHIVFLSPNTKPLLFLAMLQCGNCILEYRVMLDVFSAIFLLRTISVYFKQVIESPHTSLPFLPGSFSVRALLHYLLLCLNLWYFST